MSKKYPDCQWDLQQIRSFVENAKDRVGVAGWRFLSKEMREGLIAEEVLKTLFANARADSDEGVKVAWFRDLYNAMRIEAGLIEEGEE